jgi:hypothetical protein
MLDSLEHHIKIFVEECLSLLYPECGCCGRKLWNVQRREGIDNFGYNLRDLYGVLCDDCYEDLTNV